MYLLSSPANANHLLQRIANSMPSAATSMSSFSHDARLACRRMALLCRLVARGTNGVGAHHALTESLRDSFKGAGKPEPLKRNLAGWWSRRIIVEHQLVYRCVARAASGAGDAVVQVSLLVGGSHNDIG